MSAEFKPKLAYTATEAVKILPWGKTKVHEMIRQRRDPVSAQARPPVHSPRGFGRLSEDGALVAVFIGDEPATP